MTIRYMNDGNAPRIWYIYGFEGINIANAQSGKAFGRTGGQFRELPMVLGTFPNHGFPCFVLDIPYSILPSGAVIDAYFEITMNDNSVVRFPATGNYVVNVEGNAV